MKNALPPTGIRAQGGSNNGKKVFLPVVGREEEQSGPNPTPTPTPNPTPGPVPTKPANEAEAARFLAQAAFGGTPDDLTALVSSTYAAWFDAQKAAPVSVTKDYLDAVRTEIKSNDLLAVNVPYSRSDISDIVLAFNFSTTWMRNLINGQDQLRQRIAWCLSQIMVVSSNGVARLQQNGVAIGDYYDTLAKHALGNFKDLLFAVSTHPAMTYFLSSLGNDKADPANNQMPDENYAREVMQLFTIGLWELNQDGTQKLDADRNPIPTYDNRDIEELARVFTGLWFSGRAWPRDGAGLGMEWLTDYPLGMFEDHHDRGRKVVFHNKPWQRVFAGNQDGLPEIAAACEMLTAHPNTAPFIARALIKFLVTSNPSPAYVKRIADVFVNNGAGVRGDLFAVVKAILMDPDARNAAQIANPKHGKLQEPMLRLTRMVRAFKAGKGVPDLQYWGLHFFRAFMQHPMYSPSVFNFYGPGYRHLGALAQNGLTSPEFQILNSVTVASANNLFAEMIDTKLHRRVAGGTPDFKFDFSAEQALSNDVDALLTRLNTLLCNGQLDAATKALIAGAVNGHPSTDAIGRVHLAVWLTAVSPAAAVLR
jgi:uncharacterized protein (DUF1800 family)